MHPNPNLTTYYMAEQTNRRGLTARAEQGWRAEQAGAMRSWVGHGASLRTGIGALLIRLGTQLGGFDPAATLATPAKRTAQA